MKINLMIFPQSTYCSEDVADLIPHEDKVDVVSPFSILVIGGGGFCSLIKIMSM